MSSIHGGNRLAGAAHRKGAVTVRVRAIDGSEADLIVDRKCTGRAIWDAYTQQLGIKELDYFGLQYETFAGKGVKLRSSGGSYSLGKATRQWLSTAEPAEAQLGAPKTGAMEDGRPRWDVDFRVRFYVNKVLCDQWCNKARFLLYMQLRDDVFSGRVPFKEAQVLFLAGLAAQIHFGDWEAGGVRDAGDYLSQIDSLRLRRQPEYGGQVEAMHKKHRGMPSVQALEYYMKLVAMSPMYGVDLHDCCNSTGEPCKLGISPSGITVLSKQTLKRMDLPWRDIKNIAHNKKRLLLIRRSELSPDISTVFFFDTKPDCKVFWMAAIQQHTFFRRSEMVRKTVSLHQNAQSALNARKSSIKSRAPVPATAEARASVRKHLAEITQDNIAASPAEVGTDKYAQLVPAQSAEQLAACAAEGFSGTVEVVLMLAAGEKLGFSIAGGSDGAIGGGDVESSSPIYIKQMLVEGAAHRDGRLRVGDYVLSINGASLESKEHSEVVGLIAAATNGAGQVSVKVWREASPTREERNGNASANQSMNLSTMTDSGDASNLIATPAATDRTFTGGSTFSLVGGADTGTSLFITNAQLPDQDIRAGDELLAICGVSTDGMTVAQALALIHEADAENRLQLEVAENEIGFAKLSKAMHMSQDSISLAGTPVQPVRIGVLTPINSVKSQRRNPVTPAVTPAATPKMTSSRLSTRLSSEGQIDVFPMASFEDAMPNPPFFTRASFAFDAKSFENGISFKATDILEVLEFTDDNTWIGHHIDTGNIGEIPSAAFAQRYILLQQQQAVGNQSGPAPKAAYEIVFKQRVDDLLENPKATRPVAIFGANVDDIAGQMVAIASDDELDVCHPTFHTTRAPRENEVDGVDYHYITDPAMKQGLAAKLFVEAGTFERQVYALSLADIVNSSRQGKTVLLQTKIKAVGRLLSSTGLRPVVVFVEPAQGLSAELQEFKETYRGSFTHTIMASATIEETAQSVLRTIRASVKKPYWIRAGQPILSSSSDCPQTLDFRTNCCANKNADSAAFAAAAANAANAARGQADGLVRKKWVAPITTRPRRDNETDGKQYHFLTKEVFQSMIDGEKLQEWGTFNGEFYGVARADNVSKPKPLLRSKTLVTALLESGNQMRDKKLNPASGKTQSLKARPTQSMKEKLADRRRTELDPPTRQYSLKEKLAVRREQKAASSDDLRSVDVPDDASDADNDTAGSDYSSTCSPVDFMTRGMPRSFLNEVTLVRNNAGSFGFTLTGGVDYGDLPSISRINNVSTVESTLCDLAVGDNILAINGVCLANATHDSTINLLRNSTDMLTLVLFPSEGSGSMPSSSFLLGAELTQGETGINGFGFTTVPMADDTPGVVIRDVARGSDAEREHLSAGMHVLTVNGIDVSAGSIERVETLLTKSATASLVARGTIVGNPALQMSRRQRHDSIMSAYDPSMMAEPVILQKAVTMHKDQGSFGMRLGVDKFGITRVLNVTPGTPAEGVVEIDDQIVSINGIEASGDTRKDALHQLVSCGDVELEILYQGELQEAPFVDLNDSALVNVEFEQHEGAGLGIEIAAMPETGVYVHRLVDGGIAAGDGRIHEGDIILEVNGRPVYDQSTDEIMNWFQLNQVISIKLLRSQMNETHSITINRDSDQSLGLKIILSSIVTVASIVPGSLADLAGVPAGCQLLKVNNVALDGKSYKEIRALLCQNSKLELEVAAH